MTSPPVDVAQFMYCLKFQYYCLFLHHERASITSNLWILQLVLLENCLIKIVDMATADMPPSSATETLPSAPLETIQMKLHSRQGRFSPAPPTEPRPKQKLKIDPLRALEPARKKTEHVGSTTSDGSTGGCDQAHGDRHRSALHC